MKMMRILRGLRHKWFSHLVIRRVERRVAAHTQPRNLPPINNNNPAHTQINTRSQERRTQNKAYIIHQKRRPLFRILPHENPCHIPCHLKQNPTEHRAHVIPCSKFDPKCDLCEEVEAEDADVEDVGAEVGDVCEMGECLACGHGGGRRGRRRRSHLW